MNCEFSAYISKVSLDPTTGEMRWRMTASDTSEDVFEERMSLPLFNSFVRRIENSERIPEVFRSVLTERSGWDGGMPYASISHYLSGTNECNVPADVDSVYVDGECLKAKGTFRKSPMGQAVYKSVYDDLHGTSPFEQKVRVSIGFIDFAHSHGDFIFRRNSLKDRCPMCDSGKGNKVYLDGQLVHFAFTRVPANVRTDVILEEKSMTKEISTRLEDAQSIIGEDLADGLETRSTVSDDVLVVRSEETVVEASSCEGSSTSSESDEEDDEKKKEKEAPVEKTALQLAVESLISAVEVNKSAYKDEAIAAIQPQLDTIGEVLRGMFAERPVEPAKIAQNEPEYVAELRSALVDTNKRIADLFELVSTEVAVLKTVNQTDKLETVKSETKTVPTPRTVVQRSALSKEQKVSQIQKIAARSVGLG